MSTAFGPVSPLAVVRTGMLRARPLGAVGGGLGDIVGHRHVCPVMTMSSRGFSISGAASSVVTETSDSSGPNRLQANEAMKRYMKRAITPVSIQQMLLLKQTPLQVAPVLREELMVRLAKRYCDLNDLPGGLLDTDPVRRVTKNYYDFFQALSTTARPDTEEAEHSFSEILRDFYLRDASTLPSIFLGMRVWKQAGGASMGSRDWEILNARLDDLFTARLSVRMLIGHHTNSLTHGRSKIKRGLVVRDAAQDAAATTRALCLKRYGVCPEIKIEGNLEFKFTYVESHLHHMLFELMKNAVRAVVEQHEGTKGEKRRKRLSLSSRHVGPDGLPPVIVVISGGKEDVVIKVSDEGGGIPRSDLKRIWSYEYTTATEHDRNTKGLSVDNNHEEFVTFRENFYGFGYGLPIARVFSRYFGGDLKVISTEGWGTDAYIYINRLESAAVETLPE